MIIIESYIERNFYMKNNVNIENNIDTTSECYLRQIYEAIY